MRFDKNSRKLHKICFQGQHDARSSRDKAKNNTNAPF